MDAIKRSEAGIPVTDICRELGVSTPAFYRWKAKYSGMDVSLMSRMKELEEENRRLRKMYLDEKLKAEVVTEAFEKSGKAISQTRDGQKSSRNQGNQHRVGL